MLLVFTLFFKGSAQEIYRGDAETDENKKNNDRGTESTIWLSIGLSFRGHKETATRNLTNCVDIASNYIHRG